jgi:beta-glucanase (GH16 family)
MTDPTQLQDTPSPTNTPTGLVGSTGNDSMTLRNATDVGQGGLGDDTYYLANLSAQIDEKVGEGRDKIVVWNNLDLNYYPNVENAQIGGSEGVGLMGNVSDNVLRGSELANQIAGGKGNDQLWGGAGADVFVVMAGEGSDAIMDMEKIDKVALYGVPWKTFADFSAHLRQSGANVVLDLPTGETLTFANIQLAALTAGNFLLPVDLTNYVLAFHDDFDTLSLWDPATNKGTWQPYYPFGGDNPQGTNGRYLGGEKQVYVDPLFKGLGLNPFSTSNSILNITASASPAALVSALGTEAPNFPFMSGCLTTHKSFSQTGGYFEMRAKMPKARCWPAFWATPASGNWPPELDVIEWLGNPHAYAATVHWTDPTAGHLADGLMVWTDIDLSADFHVFGSLWTDQWVIHYLDGVERYRVPSKPGWNEPFYVMVDLAVGGWAGDPDASQFPATMQVDYVKVWRPKTAAELAAPAPVVSPPPPAPTGSTAPTDGITRTIVNVAGGVKVTLTKGSQKSTTTVTLG